MPYLVRWGDTGNEDLFFPAPDTFVVNSKDGQSKLARSGATSCWSTRSTAPAPERCRLCAVSLEVPMHEDWWERQLDDDNNPRGI